MELEYLGHACFAIYHADRILLVDPYGSGQFDGRMAYRPIDVAADWVVCSHDHIDHAATQDLRGDPTVITAGTFGPFSLSRFRLAHDEYDGRRRGGEVDALRIEAGGQVVLHLSDVGESPRAAVVDANRDVDVLLIPTGGFFTIGAAQAWEWAKRLNPKTTIPIHYATAACTLPLRGLEAVRSWFEEPELWNSHRFQVHETAAKCVIVPPRLV